MKITSSFLIIGGTGTLGRALVRSILKNYEGSKVAVMSRDEHKQALMKKEFPELRYYLGDIRDEFRVRGIVRGYKNVFHTAALKHVDVLEDAPLEAVYTNVVGTRNVVQACCDFGVNNYVFFSTDKAVDPINAYGYSKGLAEKIIWDYKKKNPGTNMTVYRWGNIIGSQGSAIPYWIDGIKNGRPIKVTDLYMTRFWLPIEWAVNYCLRTFQEHNSKDYALIPPKMKAASNLDILSALSRILAKELLIENVGFRPGEKLDEAMTSQHSKDETYLTSGNSEKYTEAELITLLQPLC